MPRRVDRNFGLLVGDAGLFSLAAVCFDPSVVLPLFVAQFTTSPLLIGAPAAIRLAGLYLPQLPVGIAVRRFERIKPFFFWQAAIGRGALLGLLLAAALADSLTPEVVVAVALLAWAVFAFTEGAATLAWLDLVGDAIHVRMRGSYFGFVQVLGGVLAVGGGFAVRAALAGPTDPHTFVPLFGWGFLVFMASVVCIGLIRERQHAPHTEESTRNQLRAILRRGHLVQVSVAQVLAGSLQFGLPFYALFARDSLGLSGEWLGSFIVAQTVGTSAGGVVWARLATRYGARLVVCASSALLVTIPLCCVGAQRLEAGGLVLAAFFVSGAAKGGSQAGFWQYVLDLVPQRDRRVFMGLANTANAPTLLMPIVGGGVLEWGGYGWLFGGAVALGIAATFVGLGLPRPRPIDLKD